MGHGRQDDTLKITTTRDEQASHDALVIAATESGGSAYKSRGWSAEATPTVLLVFNPAEPHAGHMRDSRYRHYRGLYLAAPALAPQGGRDSGRARRAR